METLEQASRMAAQKIRQELMDELKEYIDGVAKQAPSTPPTLVGQQKELTNHALRGWLKIQSGRSATEQERKAVEALGWKENQIQLDLTSGVWRGTEGTHLVPTTIASTFVQELDSYAAVRKVATVISTSTLENLVIPVVDDRANEGALLAEKGAVSMSASTDPTISSIKLGSYTFHSNNVIVHDAILRDSAINLEALLGKLLADRIGRKLNEYLTTGTGSGQPGGLLASSGGVPTLVTVESTSTIGWEDLLDMVLAIDPAYRPKAKWMMNSTTWAKVCKLQDQQKRPIAFMSVSSELPNTLYGYPVVENPDMPDVGAGTKPIIFGDFSRFYLREQNKIKLAILQERFVEYDAVGFLAFYYADSKLAAAATTRAIGCLAMAASGS